MEQDEILRMARDAGFLVDNDLFQESISLFKRFAVLAFAAGIAHEREACAKVCDERVNWKNFEEEQTPMTCATAIRARGENK